MGKLCFETQKVLKLEHYQDKEPHRKVHACTPKGKTVVAEAKGFR